MEPEMKWAKNKMKAQVDVWYITILRLVGLHFIRYHLINYILLDIV